MRHPQARVTPCFASQLANAIRDCFMKWPPSRTAIAIVIVVGIGMGIGAALLGYPAWEVPIISLLGAAGAIVAVRMVS
jgi:hypothetical protein